MALLFDKVNKIMMLEAPDTEITIQNLLNSIREWEDELSSMDIGKVCSCAGKESLGGGVSVGLTLTLLNDWQLAFEARTGPEYIQCKVSGGNIVADNINGSIYPTAFTQVLITASSSATQSDLEAIHYASFGGGVSIHIINGESGTNYPLGTIEFPVNNLSDAVSIANNRGFDTLFINCSMDLDSGTDIRFFTLVGKSLTNTNVTIDSSTLCNNITIKNCNISGVLDGKTEIIGCSIGDLTYVNGNIDNSGLYGEIVLDGEYNAVINNCYIIDQDSPPVIDMGGSGQSLIVTNYSGLISVKNLNSDNYKIGVGLDAGRLILEPSISAGSIIVSGIGMLIDNSTGTANVNTDGLISKKTITEITWDTIFLDIFNGEPGTEFPIGTMSRPSNNEYDALMIASTNNINNINIRGRLILNKDPSDITATGMGNLHSDIIDLNGRDVNNCRVTDLTISGSMVARGVQFRNSIIKNVYGMDALIMDSSLQGNITMGPDGSSILGKDLTAECNSLGSPCIIDMVGSNRHIQINNIGGCLKFLNAGDGSSINMCLAKGIVTLDSSCSGGSAVFTGVGTLINYSTMSVTDYLLNTSSIADSTWDELLAEHDVYGSAGKIQNDILENTNKINYLATGVAAPSVICNGAVITTGIETNDYTDTATLNGILHTIEPVGGITDLYYTFYLSENGVPIHIHGEGYTNKKGDNYKVYAWNWSNEEWDQIANQEGQNGTDLVLVEYSLTIGHVGISSDAGKVRLRFYSDDGSSINVDRILCAYTTVYRSVGYANGAIWVDTNVSNTDTVSYIDGVADNPVSTVTAALILSSQLGIKSFYVNNGSDITLESDCIDFTVNGSAWFIDMNGYNCEGSCWHCALVSGTCTGDYVGFHQCILAKDNKLIVDSLRAFDCVLAGEIVLNTENDYYFNSCYAGIEGITKPSIDFGVSVGTVKVNMRNYSGGIVIKNMGVSGSDILSLEGNGELVIDSSCIGGLIKIRGNFTITDEVVDGFVSGGGELYDDARYDTKQLDDIWDTDITTHNITNTFGSKNQNITPSENIDDFKADTSVIEDKLSRILGLVQENYSLDQMTYTTYQGSNLLTSGRIRVYGDAASVGTDSNVDAVYTITSTWVGNKLETYKVVKQ